MTQRNNSVTDYKTKLLNLISELNTLQINELTTPTDEQRNLIKKLNALSIFKNRLNDDLKATVCASQPKSLTDAANLALEIEKNINGNKQMFYLHKNTNGRQNSGNNNNRRCNNNNYNNYNYQHVNNHNKRQHSNNNYWVRHSKCK